MREQLIQYVFLLFAGAENAEDIRQEILQNTLDRYDDLLRQGKSPEGAYRLSISGIGDINEILGTIPQRSVFTQPPLPDKEPGSAGKLLRAIAIGLYILSPIPLFILDELGISSLGLCGTLAMIAAATIMIILGKKTNTVSISQFQTQSTYPRQELRKGINALIWAVGLACYFIVSFWTRAWFITWVIFLMTGTVQGIANACMDLKEG